MPLCMEIKSDEVGEAEYLTVSEAASLLRIGIATAYRAVNSGDLPAVRVRGAIRIRRSAISQLGDDAITSPGGES